MSVSGFPRSEELNEKHLPPQVQRLSVPPYHSSRVSRLTEGKKRKASSSLSEDEVMVVESSEVEELTLDSLVTCPSCAKKIKHGFINKHLDSGCKFMPDTKLRSKPKSKGKETEKDSWSKIFGGSRHKGPQSSGHKNKLTEDTEPLPTPTYATMKDKQIKDLLLTYDLLVTGDRTELITRHEQYVTPSTEKSGGLILQQVGKAIQR
jgi:E3 ubiquitin-protein ligase RAD18